MKRLFLLVFLICLVSITKTMGQEDEKQYRMSNAEKAEIDKTSKHVEFNYKDGFHTWGGAKLKDKNNKRDKKNRGGVNAYWTADGQHAVVVVADTRTTMYNNDKINGMDYTVFVTKEMDSQTFSDLFAQHFTK